MCYIFIYEYKTWARISGKALHTGSCHRALGAVETR